jgi:hypothetical protein
MPEKLQAKLERILHAANPCNAPESSLRWAIASTLFPECWCCAGLRGFLYGLSTAGLLWLLMG